MTSPERPRAYLVDAAAAEAGVSRRTIFRLIAEGWLEPVMIKNKRGVTEKSLREYLVAYPKYEVVNKSSDETPAQPEGAPCSVSHSESEKNSD